MTRDGRGRACSLISSTVAAFCAVGILHPSFLRTAPTLDRAGRRPARRRIGRGNDVASAVDGGGHGSFAYVARVVAAFVGGVHLGGRDLSHPLRPGSSRAPAVFGDGRAMRLSMPRGRDIMHAPDAAGQARAAPTRSPRAGSRVLSGVDRDAGAHRRGERDRLDVAALRRRGLGAQDLVEHGARSSRPAPSASKETLPMPTCAMPNLSARYSTLPALSSLTTRPTSIVTVPSFGFGMRPRVPRILPRRPTLRHHVRRRDGGVEVEEAA